jgi:hypothetical protein
MSITVLSVTVKLGISPNPPWTAGQTINLAATVTADGKAAANREVAFMMAVGRYEFEIGSAFTGSDGVARLTYTIPWLIDGVTVPCNTVSFYAIDTFSGVASNTVSGQVAYPTRISISAPSQVIVGQKFTVSGKLEYQSSSTAWSGLSGKTVSIYYNSTKLADVTTDSGGNYSATVSIPFTGTYTLKAVYAGEGFAFAPAISILGLTVAIPEAETVMKNLTYVLAAIPFIAVGGTIAWNEILKAMGRR